MSIRRRLTQCDSPHTRSSLSRTSAAGQRRASVWRCPHERTAVFGVSASGELALAIGLRHPDVYGAIFCASPGAGYRPPRVMPNPVPRTYLVAGTLEPFFLENATRWAVALRDAACRRRHDRAGRVARRRILARRVAPDGGVGIWSMKRPVWPTSPACGGSAKGGKEPSTIPWMGGLTGASFAHIGDGQRFDAPWIAAVVCDRSTWRPALGHNSRLCAAWLRGSCSPSSSSGWLWEPCSVRRKGPQRCPLLSGSLTRLTATQEAGSAHFSYTHVSLSPNPDLRGTLSGHGEVDFTTDHVRVSEVDRDISFSSTGNQPLHPVSSTTTTDAIVINGTVYEANPIPGLAFAGKYIKLPFPALPRSQRGLSLALNASVALDTLRGPNAGGISDRARTGRGRRCGHHAVRGHVRTAARLRAAPGAAGVAPTPEPCVAGRCRPHRPSAQHALLQRPRASRCEGPGCPRRLSPWTRDHGRHTYVHRVRRAGTRRRTSEERGPPKPWDFQGHLDRSERLLPFLKEIDRSVSTLRLPSLPGAGIVIISIGWAANSSAPAWSRLVVLVASPTVWKTAPLGGRRRRRQNGQDRSANPSGIAVLHCAWLFEHVQVSLGVAELIERLTAVPTRFRETRRR